VDSDKEVDSEVGTVKHLHQWCGQRNRMRSHQACGWQQLRNRLTNKLG